MRNQIRYGTIFLGALLIVLAGIPVLANPVTYSPAEKIFIGKNLLLVIFCLLAESLVVSGLLASIGFKYLHCLAMTILVNALNYGAFYRYLALNDNSGKILVAEGIVVIVETICIQVALWGELIPLRTRAKRSSPFRLLLELIPIVFFGNSLSLFLSIPLSLYMWKDAIGETRDTSAIWGTLIAVVYFALILCGLLWALKRIFKIRTFDNKGNNSPTKQPTFRTVANYLGPIWAVGILGGISFVLASNRVDDVVRGYHLFPMLFLVLPYSLLVIILIRSFFRRIACWRNEKPAIIAYRKKIYLIGILASIIIYILFQEPQPLKKYGVEFDWYDPSDDPGKFYFVHVTRKIHGESVSGPLCGDKYPRIVFSDEDGDGLEDILVYTSQDKELAVFGIVEPYIPGEDAFRLIRGAETTCSIPRNNPPFQAHLRAW